MNIYGTIDGKERNKIDCWTISDNTNYHTLNAINHPTTARTQLLAAV